MTKTMGRGAVSDGQDTNRNSAPTRILTGHKTITIYFSRSGNTEKQVHLAQTILPTDVYELVVTTPYPADYTAAVSRATMERDTQNWPELADHLPDLSSYDTVLLAHPIWAMTLANPMRTFLEVAGKDLANKRVASFSTNAGYGAGDTQQRLRQLISNTATILPNYTVEDRLATKTRNQFISWLKTFNKEGYTID